MVFLSDAVVFCVFSAFIDCQLNRNHDLAKKLPPSRLRIDPKQVLKSTISAHLRKGRLIMRIIMAHKNALVGDIEG